jgi:hypothetical protein
MGTAYPRAAPGTRLPSLPVARFSRQEQSGADEARLRQLESALGGHVDDALLDEACTVLGTLASDGGLDACEPGPRVAAAVLDQLAGRGPTLARIWGVKELRGWAEGYEEHVALAARCTRLLGRWSDLPA